MATKVYEGMFILDSNRYARDPGGVSGQIKQLVEKCGGEMLASRLWNEQKLAYQIEGHRKGTYWLTYFRLDSSKQSELARACRLNENILRNLVVRIDDRLVDTLVQHAKSSGATVAAPEGAPSAGAPAKAPAATEAPAKAAPAATDAPAKAPAATDAPATDAPATTPQDAAPDKDQGAGEANNES